MLEVSTTRAAEPAEVLRLLRQTSWGARRTLEDVRTALSVAPMHAGAWEDGRLVGFARAVTDGVYRGFIEDVVIDEPGRAVEREHAPGTRARRRHGPPGLTTGGAAAPLRGRRAQRRA